jgi:outer membrane protein assembly factor BamA
MQMRTIFLCFVLFSLFGANAQKEYSVVFTTKEYQKVKKNIPTHFKDSTLALDYLRNFQLLCIKKGYLLASYDSIHYSKNQLIAHLNLGDQLNQINISIPKESLDFIKQKAKFSEKSLAHIPFNASELNRILKSIYTSASSNGYPFVKVFLDDINYSPNSVSANLNLNLGKRFKISKINVKGDSSISVLFLASLLDIKEGNYYDENKFSQISGKIKQIPFLKEIKPHELLFTKDGVELFLYLNSVPVSSVNGAIGLQPNTVTKKLSLTGDLSLKLLNVLKRGEMLNLNWKSIQAQTQSLDAKINYPFLFKTPFGIDGHFHLYKRDTSFLELKSTIGIQYFLKGGSYLKAFYQNSSSSVLSGGKNNPSFSNLTSVSTNAYGLSLFKRQLDYIPNPSKGYSLTAEIAIGTRKKLAVDTFPEIKSTTYKSLLQFDWFLPITRRNVLHFSSTTAFYIASEIYQNEVYRFGGQTSLRGFNEEEIYATSQSIVSLEYRFLLDRNSHLFAFFDQAFYENTSNTYLNDHPYGFGLGFSFGTNIGIFSISYALGKQFDNPILMRNGKVHFGYIAYF